LLCAFCYVFQTRWWKFQSYLGNAFSFSKSGPNQNKATHESSVQMSPTLVGYCSSCNCITNRISYIHYKFDHLVNQIYLKDKPWVFQKDKD
jgi:hypothetical protein